MAEMTPDELFKLKKEEKKAKRRNQVEEKAALGMTSLMDIVSIIVVYLLKSYASDPITITPIAEQKIPMSKMDAPIKEGVAIYVSSRELHFGDESVAVLTEGEPGPERRARTCDSVALREARGRDREVQAGVRVSRRRVDRPHHLDW